MEEKRTKGHQDECPETVPAPGGLQHSGTQQHQFRCKKGAARAGETVRPHLQLGLAGRCGNALPRSILGSSDQHKGNGLSRAHNRLRTTPGTLVSAKAAWIVS